MKTIAISVLLMAGAAFAGAANAQGTSEPSVSPPVAADPVTSGGYEPSLPPPTSVWNDDFPNGRNRIEEGIDALEARNLAVAENIFADILRRYRNDPEANFYMGVTRMDLGKWEDAKKPLEIAVRKKPKHPDPKSRLGVTYAKLGDTTAANAQRAELVKMADACKSACKLSPYIAGGIRMIDEALAQPRALP